MKPLYTHNLVAIDSENLKEGGFILGAEWNSLLSEFSEDMSLHAGVTNIPS
jgi:hypothetical protein